MIGAALFVSQAAAFALKVYSGLPLVSQVLAGAALSFVVIAGALAFFGWYLNPGMETGISPECDSVVVRNTGEDGTFRAKIRILEQVNFAEAIPGPTAYDGYWVKSEKCETSIYAEHEDRLLIGNVRHDSSAPGNPIATLNLYRCESGGIVKAIQRPYFFENSVDIRVRVEVTFSRVPQLRARKLVRQYWLTRDGLRVHDQI